MSGPLRIRHATTALEAKFCVPFQMAAIALRRKAGLEEFADDFVQSLAVQALQKKVTAVVDPAIAVLGKDKFVFDIELKTHDGHRYAQRSSEHYRGGPAHRLTWAELCSKFHECAAQTVDARGPQRFLDLTQALPRLDDASVLLHALSSAGTSGDRLSPAYLRY